VPGVNFLTPFFQALFDYPVNGGYFRRALSSGTVSASAADQLTSVFRGFEKGGWMKDVAAVVGRDA
jgi:hypothetical protein